ncbi:D-amino-acid transaminase [Pseudobacillus wudalianchiensis]|uniref:D-alanine aminotransferase n=1 Tax=Pseudobacillus wudalianchiensis TaxID=1743143 RepID=A0A1B9AY65_9BACI|nr:D-amino-acid transaminase [Bacillus wudalianchiensis]OCA88764.1 D-amino-acid transaminase [Bacillus wudalianchiensis]
MALAYFNGKIIGIDEPVIPIDERGHQFGDGVYEVIRFYQGKPFMMKEHLERLYKSAKAIKLEIGKEQEELETIMLQLVEKSGLADADLYMQATRGIAPRNHLFPTCPASISITVKPARELSQDVRTQGVKVALLPDERWQNCYIKSLNLLPNILAKQEAFEQGCFEAVLVREGIITEGSSTNVFIVKEGRVQTAPLSNHILAGITRMAVKEVAEELKVPFIEKSFTPEELFQADEVFLTSTTSEVLAVTNADDCQIGDGRPGSLTMQLHKGFRQKTR